MLCAVRRALDKVNEWCDGWLHCETLTQLSFAIFFVSRAQIRVISPAIYLIGTYGTGNIFDHGPLFVRAKFYSCIFPLFLHRLVIKHLQYNSAFYNSQWNHPTWFPLPKRGGDSIKKLHLHSSPRRSPVRLPRSPVFLFLPQSEKNLFSLLQVQLTTDHPQPNPPTSAGNVHLHSFTHRCFSALQ